MTALAITGMGLTGVLRLTWVHDNLAHVLEHCEADEPSGTWTGLAGPGYGLALGADVDNAVLRQLADGSEIADLIWEAPDELVAEHAQVFQAAMRAYQCRRLPTRRAALGGPPGHLVTRLVGELRSTGAHAGHGPDPVLAGQAPALGGRLLRAPHQPSRPPTSPRAQHRDRRSDNWGVILRGTVKSAKRTS